MILFLLVSILIFVAILYVLRARISSQFEIVGLLGLFVFNVIFVPKIFEKYHWFGAEIGLVVLCLLINTVLNSFLPLILLLKKK